MPSLREILTAKLSKLPGIEAKTLSDHPGFVYFQYNGKEVAHFDSDNELDVRLTKSEIKREGLNHPTDSTRHPRRHRNKPHWIVLKFNQKSHINEVVRLVKLATEQV